MAQPGAQMGMGMEEAMGQQQEMPMEEEQVEESPTDIRRRMMEQYLQQA
jgi:hypothetical protein